jgi:hypothetical protein
MIKNMEMTPNIHKDITAGHKPKAPSSVLEEDSAVQ